MDDFDIDIDNDVSDSLDAEKSEFFLPNWKSPPSIYGLSEFLGILIYPFILIGLGVI